MMKRNLSSRILVVTSMALGLAMLPPVAHIIAAPQDAESRLIEIEDRTDQIALLLQQVRQNLNKANRFADDASAWTTRLNQAEMELRDLETQKKNGNFNIYDNRQMDDQILSLRQKLEGIRQLDGGQEIDGATYMSIEELQAGMKQKGEEAMRLNNDYLKLTRQLLTMDQERDRLIDQVLNKERKRAEADRDQLRYLQEDLDLLQAVVNSDKLWLMPGPLAMGAGVPHMSRELIISLITKDYLYQLQTTPGAQYNAQELASRIRNFRDQSEGLKRELRDSIIPETLREINELQRRIQRVTVGSPDIQGCWVVLVGNGDYPVVTITSNGSGDYDAVITRLGQLDFFKQGDRMFSVYRVNDNTYDGTEYSFTTSGRPVEIALRLIVSGDGASINYRSDSVLVLRRCD